MLEALIWKCFGTTVSQIMSLSWPHFQKGEVYAMRYFLDEEKEKQNKVGKNMCWGWNAVYLIQTTNCKSK